MLKVVNLFGTFTISPMALNVASTGPKKKKKEKKKKGEEQETDISFLFCIYVLFFLTSSHRRFGMLLSFIIRQNLNRIKN